MFTDNIARVEHWTEIRSSDLKKMWLEGQSASQIARKLGGVSRNAVIGKVHRMGLAGRDRPTPPRAVGRTNRRTFGGGQETSIPRNRPAFFLGAPAPALLLGPEPTATATIMTLVRDACRWPIGDPKDATFGYCGRSRGQHASYCDHHAFESKPERPSRRSAADLVRLFVPVAGR